MNPRWYRMPDVFERWFRRFGHDVDAMYDLVRLDPSYRVTLLAPENRQWCEDRWQRVTMSPSSLLVYLGVEGGVGDLPHHTLFFDHDLDRHMDEVNGDPRWPEGR